MTPSNQSPIEPMNFNEQLRAILWQVHKNGQWFATPIAEQKPHSFGKDVQEAETAIHTLIEEAIGGDEVTERNGLIGLTHKDETRSQLRADLRAKFNVEKNI